MPPHAKGEARGPADEPASAPKPPSPARRYVIGDEIAAGGMATVHLGRARAEAGFARSVAIKRLHAQYAKDPDFFAMLLDEGRLAASIQHPNVVRTLDVVASGDDLFVVMEYLDGAPLNTILRDTVRRGERVPPPVAAAIVAGALRGLHAAHEARDAGGALLGVVHRDVSPQNILVGVDGTARVLDFGIAKARGRAHATATGQIKGKFAYMPPEQLHGEELDRRADVYAAGVVLWESLAGARLFLGADQSPNLKRLLAADVDPPSARAPGLDPAYDAIALRALARAPDDRFPTALDMALALERAGPVATPAEVGAFVEASSGAFLAERAARIEEIERKLTARLRDSQHLLDTLDETVTDVLDLPLPLLPPPPPAQPLVDTDDAITVPRARKARLPSAPSRPSLPGWPPVRRGWPLAGWLAAGLAAVALTITAIAAVRSPAAAPDAPPIGPASLDVSADPPPPAPSAAPEPSVTADPPSAASASASSHHRAPPRPAARPRPSPARPDTCSPPFTLDAEGHKHYKRECLQ